MERRRTAAGAWAQPAAAPGRGYGQPCGTPRIATRRPAASDRSRPGSQGSPPPVGSSARSAAYQPRAAQSRQRPTSVTCPISISKPSSARKASAATEAARLSHLPGRPALRAMEMAVLRRRERRGTPRDHRRHGRGGPARAAQGRRACDRPSTGWSPASRTRHRSTSSAPVMWPSAATSTSITVRRCGVQRSPRSCRRSPTALHGFGRGRLRSCRLVWIRYCNVLQ